MHLRNKKKRINTEVNLNINKCKKNFVEHRTGTKDKNSDCLIKTLYCVIGLYH